MAEILFCRLCFNVAGLILLPGGLFYFINHSNNNYRCVIYLFYKSP